MLINSGSVANNLGINQSTMEVPETGTYRSTDGTISKRYRAGDRVSRHEYDLLQMAPEVVIGETPEEFETDPDSEFPGETGETENEPEFETDLPEAKADPEPSNKAEKPPKNKQG